MRSDLAKVIVERPRKGGYGKANSNKNIDFEDLPLKESIKRPYSWNMKSLNENLAPLYRCLRKNCGRPWDKVHSEICENIRETSTVQRHILQHLDQMIEKNTFVGKDDKAWFHSSLGWGSGTSEAPIKDSYMQFYICPKSRLLKYNKDYRGHSKLRTNKDKPTDRHKVSAAEQYVKLDGVWYAVVFKPYIRVPIRRPATAYLPARTVYESIHDPVIAKLDQQANARVKKTALVGYTYHAPEYVDSFWGTKGVHAVKSKQLNGRELKKLGLKNDEQES